MRPFLLLSLVLPLLMAQPSRDAGDLCGLAGQVSNIVTGEPVRKASISLATASSPAAYSTTSDAAGHFSFNRIEPGQYRLRASRNGYITLTTLALGSAPPAATMSLAPGQHLDGIALKMTPHGAISGRVLDEDGDPAPNARVVLQRYRYLHGRKQMSLAGPSAVTNDLGEYRLFGIAPGKYFVSATPEWTPPDTGATTPPVADYVTTWFPGVIDPAAAALLDVAAGSQLTGIQVTLSKGRTVHVSGRVTHAGSEDQNVRVFLTPRPPGGVAASLPSALAVRTGAFDIPNVTPGSYNLIALVAGGAASRVARMPIEVKNANVENLSVTIGAGITVKGYLRADDGSSPVDLSNLTVTLQPRAMFYGKINPSKLDRAGAFIITDVAPDTYDLSLSGLASDDYVKSIRADAIDVLASGLDLTSGTAPGILEVVVSHKAATVAGIVRYPSGAPAPGATVVLVPREPHRRAGRHFYKTAVSDTNGAFSLSSLPPGEYMAFAWQVLDGEAWLDPDFLKPLEKSGEPVSLQEGDRKSVNLNLLPNPR